MTKFLICLLWISLVETPFLAPYPVAFILTMVPMVLVACGLAFAPCRRDYCPPPPRPVEVPKARVVKTRRSLLA